MPPCKNDPKRKYKGDEPSPKGFGWCAHCEKEGKVRKGRDGNKWITKKVSNGSLRWAKVVDKNVIKLYNHLEKKLSPFWYKIVSEYSFIIIKKDKSYKKIVSKMKSQSARYNDLNALITKYENDKNIVAVLTSGSSSDNLTFFIYYLLTKTPLSILEHILQSKNITKYICENYKLFFKKSYKNGNEYGFKWNDNITLKNISTKYTKKLSQSKIINKLL